MGDDEQYQADSDSMAGDMPRRSSPLPWVLFVLTVLLAAIIAVVLMIRVDAERSKSAEAAQEVEQFRTRNVTLEGEKKALEQRVDELEKEKSALAAERDVLADKLKQGGKTPAQAKAAPASKKKSKKHHR